MATTIQLRVDDELKDKSDSLFKSLGTDTTSAIRMFLTQAIANNGFPFEIKKREMNPYVALSEDEILEKLESSRKQVDMGEYKSADETINDMRLKYEL